MQVNEQDVEVQSSSDSKTKTTQSILQPSFVSSQSIKKQSNNQIQLPLLILPQFLWNIPVLQLHWMMLSTMYLAAMTDFEFFGDKCFANAFTYFDKLGYFDEKYQSRVVIDLYNLLEPGKALYDAAWIVGSSLYNSRLGDSMDVPQIHTTQNSQNYIVGNGIDGFYINFLFEFNNKKKSQHVSLLNQQEFTKMYDMPYQDIFIYSVERSILNEELFITIVGDQGANQRLICEDKNDQIHLSQMLYLDNSLTNIKLVFLSDHSNWVGSVVPDHCIGVLKNGISRFKIVCNYDQLTNKHYLRAFLTSPIDKMSIIHTVNFSEYPITELYYDVYHSFKVLPFTRCYIVQNNERPECLSGLTENDWRDGIYFILSVKNNDSLSDTNHGYITITFYKGDKTLLGSFDSFGLYNNTQGVVGVRERVSAYTLSGKEVNSIYNLFLSTGILFKYVQHDE